MRSGVSGVNAYFQPRKCLGSIALSVLAVGPASPFVRERGQVRVSSELIEVLDNDPSPSSSALEQGERDRRSAAEAHQLD
jgi:hypothetical protein